MKRKVVPFVSSTASIVAPATDPPRLEVAMPFMPAYGTATFAVTSAVPIVPSAALTVRPFAWTVRAYGPGGRVETLKEPSGRLVTVR